MDRRLQAELGEKHVQVSAIEPDTTHNDLHDHITDKGVRERTAGIHDIVLHSEDIAETNVFVVSLPARANLQQAPSPNPACGRRADPEEMTDLLHRQRQT
ncbi:hypothetical protein JHN63_11025 [Streptomyces sp. MBT65]|uniref:hypothetical protein n=1 Tax=Streptomyces sp. MBT65 TaxID=1488395 RepID=UPI00190C7F0B|nr:hypothetical protein [Streptomyces sp. MBT65]MBK3574338.1 hypothetical protein [Streptomyces sp. MBT65]